ncbi:hypothetical protein RWV98_02815 [Agathobaculum sp. NTUH-O15-33]|uniref:hypothetical protein n=1 Tax=Agathobaculum sp. NTUH-O15-33 TaxID=3079302 RepID=UPI0029587E86|nr:hypothetical protein [Agathobaculum sp. NTUH-O15-33]WNX85224.1 hypothetical protein RWV98_02815 [Agathobaculum sp. NTUH-O15-33]
MTHLFDKAKMQRDEDGKNWLCLRVKNAPMARNETGHLKPDKIYSAEIKLHRERRSGRANAYAWELMGKLAAVTGIAREEIYREYIPDVGDNFRAEYCPDEKLRDLVCSLWRQRGLGWVTENAGGGWLLCYYGSSTYDSDQMARLINLIVQDCQEQGIETATPEQQSRWLGDWKPQERAS